MPYVTRQIFHGNNVKNDAKVAKYKTAKFKCFPVTRQSLFNDVICLGTTWYQLSSCGGHVEAMVAPLTANVYITHPAALNAMACCMCQTSSNVLGRLVQCEQRFSMV